MRSKRFNIIFSALILLSIVGDIIYVWKHDEKPSVEISENTMAKVGFDQCNKPDAYSQEAWFTGFKAASTSFYSQISQLCYSKNGQLVIAMLPGSYCVPNAIYRYNTQASILEKATLLDKARGCLASAEKFGQQTGNVFEIKGEGGDAGCRSEMYFDYDFSKNVLELKKEFNICEWEKEGRWHNY